METEDYKCKGTKSEESKYDQTFADDMSDHGREESQQLKAELKIVTT